MIERDKIAYVITASVPGQICNLKCKYCYVSNCSDNKNIGVYNYDVERMVEAFSPERLGGIADILVIGGGETLLAEQIVPFVHGLLKQGHLVEVVTNLTLNDRIDQLLEAPAEDLKRLIVKGSLHWLELKRLNKIDDYFNNMNKILNAGASSYPFLVLCDDYMPYIDEIRQTCISKVGAPPHCTPSLVFEKKTDNLNGGKVKTSPECTDYFVNEIRDKFNSKVFDITTKFLNVDVTKIFCYAGEWSFAVDIGSGNLRKCHCCSMEANFFEHIEAMPRLRAIGNNCQIATCALQYNFTALGLIPEVNCIENYTQILERPEFYNKTARNLRNFKFTDFSKQYTIEEQERISKEVCEIFKLLKINEYAKALQFMIKKSRDKVEIVP